MRLRSPPRLAGAHSLRILAAVLSHPRRHHRRLWALVLGAVTLAVSLIATVGPAAAEREHRVRSGQSLGRIARRYNVSVQDLAAANAMRPSDNLQEGQTLIIPEEGVYYVRPGQTLSTIARRNDTSVAALRRANNLRSDSVRPGQRLIMPGTDNLEEREAAERRWGRVRHPGVARFFRVATRERERVRLVSSNRRSRRAARRRLGWLFRHRQTNLQREPSARLVELLARISDHFGGREISIMSGYRPAGDNTQESSRHTTGDAVDMGIRGVPKRVLRDYCRTLDRVGVGYYPNSSFVHFDVRDRSAYWVDRSGPGERPDYDREAARRGD